MRAVLLLASNFLRQQRWLIVVLVFYAVGMACVFGFSDIQPSAEDVTFFLRQQSLYAPLFSAFLAVSAIHNERKSRRILAVMSKAITRLQYLAGFVLGICAIAAVYCVAIAIAGTWLAHSAHISIAGLWYLPGTVLIASALVSAVALFFSTFLMPIFAAVATAASITVAAVLAHSVSPVWGSLLPIYVLLTSISQSTPAPSASADWRSMVIAVVETVMFWGLASWIFSGRDITTALE